MSAEQAYGSHRNYQNHLREHAQCQLGCVNANRIFPVKSGSLGYEQAGGS